MIGLLGKKIGMTQIITSAGEVWPVTVLEIQNTKVTAHRTTASNGYTAIQVAYGKNVSLKRVTAPIAGQFKKANIEPRVGFAEFRVAATELETYPVGSDLGPELFAEGEYVDAHGTSIGKGFQGGIKRWNQHRGPESHGSMQHRRIGSIGSSSFPSRTWKGHRMPGHLGDEKCTAQNLLVVKILKEDNLLLVRGATPGPRNSVLTLTRALKMGRVDLTEYIEKRAARAAAASEGAKEAKKPVKKK